MARLSFLVVARSDGRGGVRPFGNYGARQAGAKVWIGDRRLTVGRDGRVNIPKAIMDEYGSVGADGRKRVAVTFSSSPGLTGWKDLSAMVIPTGPEYDEGVTGDLVTTFDLSMPMLEPEDVNDRSWSP